MSDLWKYFQCQRCGKCCEQIGLPYDPSRMSQIADHLNISVDELIERYYGRRLPEASSYQSNNAKRTPCPFLRSEGAEKRCSICPVRPEG